MFGGPELLDALQYIWFSFAFDEYEEFAVWCGIITYLLHVNMNCVTLILDFLFQIVIMNLYRFGAILDCYCVLRSETGWL